MRSEVFTAVSLKTQTGWDRMMCCWVRSPNVAKDHDAFMFRVKQAKKKKLLALLDPEDEDTMILCYIRNYLPVDTSYPR
jgi:hypothetical protein